MQTSPLKILYGVQATGNGHIARARALVPALRAAGAEVTCLFSGREKEKFFEMDVFGDYALCEGFTFAINEGRVSYRRTVFNSNARGFIRDVHNLDVSSYDLVLSDYEPITAWAAKTSRKTSIGIGNQYAYKHDIPLDGVNMLTKTFMTSFAPVDLGLGLHWNHFGQPILPPMIDPVETSSIDPGKIVVYMGFENVDHIVAMAKPFADQHFMVYSPEIKTASDMGNVSLRPPSRNGFRADLASCEGVIANAGFELASEVLQMGRKLLIKPVAKQMEQLSNAKALRQLNLGATMNTLDTGIVGEWLERDDYNHVTFPEVAPMIAEWIAARDWNDPAPLISKAWFQSKPSP